MAVTEGKLREDLFHRLECLPHHLRRLRERGVDMKQLRSFFSKSRMSRRHPQILSRDALARLYQASLAG